MQFTIKEIVEKLNSSDNGVRPLLKKNPFIKKIKEHTYSVKGLHLPAIYEFNGDEKQLLTYFRNATKTEKEDSLKIENTDNSQVELIFNSIQKLPLKEYFELKRKMKDFESEYFN